MTKLLLARALALTLASFVMLSACAAPAESGGTARPVTSAESELLAIARFANFDHGSRRFATTVQERGVELRLQGWVDYPSQLGYAAVTGDFRSQAMIWTDGVIGIIAREPDAHGDPILPMPALNDPGLALDSMDPTTSRLDALLGIISALGADRPDNPLLLRQSGALWLRADDIDGTSVSVFAAPPSDAPRDASAPPLTADSAGLRLWLDATGLMLRAEARIGDQWTTIDFSTTDAPALELGGVTP
ncbi:hypothetical protein [Salinibacterium sp. ZJ70]|uniref:hypothetical protein n=1 Tax=Salinibacterium sp. ZJ70 TaxID=2708084 RepID=UPI00141DC76B|nr:hypothetical protein [Salinibacterium sp. ZJ70]